MQKTEWHAKTVPETARQLKTSLETGLTSENARQRLEVGRNVVAEGERPKPLSILASQFTDTMVLVLLAATLLSAWRCCRRHRVFARSDTIPVPVPSFQAYLLLSS